MWVLMHIETRVDIKSLLKSCSTLSFDIVSLTEPGVFQLEWLASEPRHFHLHFCSTDFKYKLPQTNNESLPRRKDLNCPTVEAHPLNKLSGLQPF